MCACVLSRPLGFDQWFALYTVNVLVITAHSLHTSSCNTERFEMWKMLIKYIWPHLASAALTPAIHLCHLVEHRKLFPLVCPLHDDPPWNALSSFSLFMYKTDINISIMIPRRNEYKLLNVVVLKELHNIWRGRVNHIGDIHWGWKYVWSLQDVELLTDVTNKPRGAQHTSGLITEKCNNVGYKTEEGYTLCHEEPPENYHWSQSTRK